jgi:pyridoxine 5-phosphate synthase
MAATDEMLEIAIKTKPNAVCIVPEKRQEVTTEGGLDLIKNQQNLERIIKKIRQYKIRVSLFIDPDFKQIDMAKKLQADIIEIHTGEFCNLVGVEQNHEFTKIKKCVEYASSLGLECHAGHGLNYQTAKKIAKIPQIYELNILRNEVKCEVDETFHLFQHEFCCIHLVFLLHFLFLLYLHPNLPNLRQNKISVEVLCFLKFD